MPENNLTLPYDPGNITIDYCHLTHSKGSLGLLNAVHEFRISYGLNQQSSIGSISVLDTTDMLANLDPDGTEVLTIGWHSQDDEEIKQKFSIFKIETIIDPDKGVGKVYVFHGVSHTHMEQLSMDINRSFKGTIKSFAEKIFNEIPQENKTRIPIDAHKTTGVSTIIIPGETPFEAIHRLTKRVYSTKYSSSLFNFYQNSKNYCFHNIEQLIAEGRDKATTYIFTPNSPVDDMKTLEGKHTIAFIDFPKGKDMLKKVTSGAYASNVAEIDIIGQKIDTTQLTVKENFNDFYHLDQPAITLDKTKAIEERLNRANTTRWINKYFDGRRHLEFNMGPQITKSKFYAESLNQLQMHCVIHGNSSLDCGQIIDLSMLERSGQVFTGEQEKKISGKYIIDTIVHYYKRGRYSCALQCNKESNRANVTNLDEYIIGDRK